MVLIVAGREVERVANVEDDREMNDTWREACEEVEDRRMPLRQGHTRGMGTPRRL